MKKLQTHITVLLEYYNMYYNTLNPTVPHELESLFNEFIYKNYKNIRRHKYIKVFLDDKTQNFKILINPEFEEEMKIHYPERLI